MPIDDGSITPQKLKSDDDFTNVIGGAFWTSGTFRTVKERGQRVAHLDDFSGADPTGQNTSHAAIILMLQQAQASRVWAEIPAGQFSITESLGQYEGLRLRGAGNGFWRARPFSSWSAGETQDPYATRIIAVGTGPKTREIADITASRQCGFHRTNHNRYYETSNDQLFEMFDGTNQDANQTTPATLKRYSFMLGLGSDDQISKPSYIRDIMFVPNCAAGADNGIGVRGYGDLVNIVPFADWDFGLIINSASMSEFLNVNVVGYFRERGVFISPTSIDSLKEGQGEQFHWKGGYIQSGLAIRSGDIWPIIAKTENSVDVRWTSSHRFPSSGSITTSDGTLAYSSLTYVAGSPSVLRFGGITDTSKVTANSTVIQSSGSTGISHTMFEGMYIADRGHSSGLEAPNPSFSGQATKYAAAIEASGFPCRAAKFFNVTPIVSGKVGFHIGCIENIEMYACYTEPKSAKTMEGGSTDLPSGCLFIAGAASGYQSEVALDYSCSIENHGSNFAGPVNRSPLVRPTTNSRTGPQDEDGSPPDTAGETDVFNPSYYFDTRVNLIASSAAVPGLGTRDLEIRGLNNRAVSVNRRTSDGFNRNIIRGDADNTVTLGNSSDTKLTVTPPLNVVLPVVTAAQLAAASDPINTADKRQGKPVWDSTNFRVMIAAGTAPTATWRVSSGSGVVTPS